MPIIAIVAGYLIGYELGAKHIINNFNQEAKEKYINANSPI
jgi:hypothetical protein